MSFSEEKSRLTCICQIGFPLVTRVWHGQFLKWHANFYQKFNYCYHLRIYLSTCNQCCKYLLQLNVSSIENIFSRLCVEKHGCPWNIHLRYTTHEV